jgi:hypothetical protein
MDKKQKYLTYQLQCLVLYYWTLDTPPREECWCWTAFWVTLFDRHIHWIGSRFVGKHASSGLARSFFKPSFLSAFLSLFPSLLYLLSVHLIQQLYPSVNLSLCSALLSFSPLIFTLPFAKSLAFIAFHLPVDPLVSVGSASHLCVARLVHLHRPSSSRCRRWDKPFGATQISYPIDFVPAWHCTFVY